MRTMQQFARELSQQLRPYLAIGTEPEDVYAVILGMMKREMQMRENAKCG
jgi:meiotically up-regulated gene 157 (Mug157) protein